MPRREQEKSLTVLQVGAMSFVGTLLLMLFATLFVGVTVYPYVHWFIHWPESGKVARAQVGSVLGAAALSVILMAGTVVRNWLRPVYRA